MSISTGNAQGKRPGDPLEAACSVALLTNAGGASRLDAAEIGGKSHILAILDGSPAGTDRLGILARKEKKKFT